MEPEAQGSRVDGAADDELRPARSLPMASTPAPADEVDDASLESFPASDPPAWSGMCLGPPARTE